MKILITGGSGFVASYLVKHCLEKGDTVIVTARWNEDLSRLEEYRDKVTIEWMELTDLSSIIRVINRHRPDVISHLAAQSWPPYSMINPIWTIEANTIGTLNILEAVRIIREVELAIMNIPKKGGFVVINEYNPLIHICSSSEVYGKVEKEDLPITENHKFNPGNIYGVGKAGADFCSQLYSKYYDLQILITRMFTHTGANRSMMSAENYYAKEVAMREIDGDNVIRIGDDVAMNSHRTWADVRDAVRNYYTLFQNNKTGIYNISGQTVKTIREVLDYLIDISNIKNKDKLIFIVDEQFVRKVNVDNQIVDISKFKQDNEWSNEITFEELMSSLLYHWRNKLKGGIK